MTFIQSTWTKAYNICIMRVGIIYRHALRHDKHIVDGPFNNEIIKKKYLTSKHFKSNF